MRVFAHYDSKGGVRALITVQGPEGAIGMPTPAPGMFVAEVDGLKLDGRKVLSGAPDVVEALREIAKDHVVESPLPRCTLTKTGKAGKKG